MLMDIRISEFDLVLFEFKQYINISLNSKYSHDIFYSDL